MWMKLIILQKMSTILISSAALDSMKRMALSHKWGSSIIKRGASMAMKRDVLIYGKTQKPSRCIFVKISVEKIYVYSCGVEMTLTITVSTMIHIFLNELGVHWFGHFCWTLTKDLQQNVNLNSWIFFQQNMLRNYYEIAWIRKNVSLFVQTWIQYSQHTCGKPNPLFHQLWLKV